MLGFKRRNKHFDIFKFLYNPSYVTSLQFCGSVTVKPLSCLNFPKICIQTLLIPTATSYTF